MEQLNELNNQCDVTENRTISPKAFTDFNEALPIHKNCKVCASGIVDKIHELRPGRTLEELSALLLKDFQIELSKSNLSYHFCRYSQALQLKSARKLYARFEEESDTLADHKHKTLFLCDVTFDHILSRLESGTLNMGIDEFEKLVKLFHSLKSPEEAIDETAFAIFERASEKYGCTIRQGVLIRNPQRADELTNAK